jgi:hypothetical protein
MNCGDFTVYATLVHDEDEMQYFLYNHSSFLVEVEEYGSLDAAEEALKKTQGDGHMG